MTAPGLHDTVARLFKVPERHEFANANLPLRASPPDPIAGGLLLGVDLPVGQQLLPAILGADDLKVDERAGGIELLQIEACGEKNTQFIISTLLPYLLKTIFGRFC